MANKTCIVNIGYRLWTDGLDAPTTGKVYQYASLSEAQRAGGLCPVSCGKPGSEKREYEKKAQWWDTSPNPPMVKLTLYLCPSHAADWDRRQREEPPE